MSDLPVAFPPASGKGFRNDAQGVCHAIDAIEKGDYLRGVMDGAVIEPHGAQGLDVLRPYFMRCARQLVGMGAERAFDIIQPGFAPVSGDAVHPGVRRFLAFKPVDLGPEVMRVAVGSVATVIDLADDDREHFPLRATER